LGDYLKKGMKVLVNHDGSVHADNALTEAIEIAKEFSGSITLLNVYDRADQEEESQRLLKKVEENVKKAQVEYHVRSIFAANIPLAITRLAEDEEFDLIALGSRGVGGARAWLLGSVSHRVITEAHCPVLVVK
jgi:nucleotide-binding universal stress UspA family protein